MYVHDYNPYDNTNAAAFCQPTADMKSHMKPLFIRAKANGKVVKRVLIDGGATINLILEHMIGKLQKTSSDILPYNMVVTDFNGKTSTFSGCLVLDLKVGSVL